MSEYQYVAFRAIDAPVSQKNLQYMRQQSSRAEITAWSFKNEYHFGDFKGDAKEMLRRGYDFHLHYANFGVRKLMIRLPNGLPDTKVAKPYFEKDSLDLFKDEDGPGTILRIEPYFEAGVLDELWEQDGLLDRLLPLRDEILEGDLRPLYLAHLAVLCDDNHDPEEEKEAPVPAGLQELTHAQRALMEWYGLNEGLVAAAAQESPPLPQRTESGKDYAAWLKRQPDATKNAWLRQLMADPHATVRREVLAEYGKSRDGAYWPTVHAGRTITRIKAAGEKIQKDKDRQAAEAAARRRPKKLADMAADPAPTLRETEELVKQRNSYAYQQLAHLLADLREALSGGDRSDLAEQQARKLCEWNPTLKLLTSELRRKGFVKKRE